LSAEIIEKDRVGWRPESLGVRIGEQVVVSAIRLAV
jgi:hypothetical protein